MLAAHVQITLGMPVTLKAPLHEQRVFAPRHRHLIHRAVTRRAIDSPANVNAVIEINEVRKIVHASPFERAVLAKTGAHGFERRTIGPNLRMAIHARLRWRNSCEVTFFDRCVAVTAVDTDTRHMMLVAERHRLHAHHARLREVWGPDDGTDHRCQSRDDKHRAEDADSRQRVRAAVKNLGHTGKSDPVSLARWVPWLCAFVVFHHKDTTARSWVGNYRPVVARDHLRGVFHGIRSFDFEAQTGT